MIAIVDYGRGNLGSVERLIRDVGVPAVVTQDPKAVDAKGARIPGKGKRKAIEDAPGRYVKEH